MSSVHTAGWLIWALVASLLHGRSHAFVPSPRRLVVHTWSSSSRTVLKPSFLAVAKSPLEATETPVDAAKKSVADGSDADQTSKLRRLKDRMWVREALEDLTAAEFASSIDAPGTAEDKGSSTSAAKGKKRAVDFENIRSQLDRRLEEMCVASTNGEYKGGVACYPLDFNVTGGDNQCFALVPGEGMGSVVYSDEQRDALLMRILASRQTLLKVMEGHGADLDPTAAGDLDQIRVQLRGDQGKSSVVVMDNTTQKGMRENRTTIDDLKVYVRDDGTIDWDGALQDRAALKKFGTSVWSRINGMDPENLNEDELATGDEHATEKKVTVKIVETDAIRKEKALLDDLQEDLKKTQVENTALLNSAVAAGSAVANVNFASLEPSLRAKIRASSGLLEKKKQEVSFQTLKYELERIFTYLDGEMGNTATKGYIPLQDRLNVAEFGLLESQIGSLNNQLGAGDTIDADVLAVMMEQLTDFKRRLGIDYYVTGVTFDVEAIQRYSSDLLEKTKVGYGFYVKGGQLFWDDILYSVRLIGRALQGYTLQPREVRTLRRTFKDLVNFVPFVIILIIPLSPIGHVLVFGAIQRVFPDFFPSCFTERRQNLLNLYESTEYTEVVIEETLQEKLTRAFEAAAFIAANNAKELYRSIGIENDKSDEKE